MRNFGHISAVHLYIDIAYESNGELGENKVKIPIPADPWKIEIVRQSDQLNNYVFEKTQEVAEYYKSEVEARKNADGRVINLSFPVQLNQGVTKLASLIERAEPELDTFSNELEMCAENASFGTNGIYDSIARDELKSSRRIIKRARLFLHTYLWILWTRESLEQANRFGGLLEDGNHFPENSESSFNHIAHPPLVVATLGCTAMLEEIGAFYINKLTSESIPPDNTSCSKVVAKIRKEHPEPNKFDIKSINETVVEMRNDISHYITRRSNLVALEEFGEYCEAILEGLALVEDMLARLLAEGLDVQNKPFFT